MSFKPHLSAPQLHLPVNLEDLHRKFSAKMAREMKKKFKGHIVHPDFADMHMRSNQKSASSSSGSSSSSSSDSSSSD